MNTYMRVINLIVTMVDCFVGVCEAKFKIFRSTESEFQENSPYILNDYLAEVKQFR